MVKEREAFLVLVAAALPGLIAAPGVREPRQLAQRAVTLAAHALEAFEEELGPCEGGELDRRELHALRLLVGELLAWADGMGGWDAAVWERARELAAGFPGRANDGKA